MGKFCPRCGTQSQDDANFCMKCGYNFSEPQTGGTVVQPVVATANPQQKASSQTRPWVQNSGVVNPYPVAGYAEYNPTFHCKCEYCYYEFDYHSYDLGHRAWYPHGFVYCPRCQRPLRHKLEYEVKEGSAELQPAAPAPAEVNSEPAVTEPEQAETEAAE